MILAIHLSFSRDVTKFYHRFVKTTVITCQEKRKNAHSERERPRGQSAKVVDFPWL